MSIILASTSPRRQQLLTQVGVEFSTYAVNIDETPQTGEKARDYVQRMAYEKSLSAIQALTPSIDNSIVITADTIGVVHDQTAAEVILIKPTSFNDAQYMWQLMSNNKHTVITAVCVASHTQRLYACVETQVEFIELTAAMQENYWHTGEPQDKAGAYAIQGKGAAWVKSIIGSYANVVGLPLVETLAMIHELKVK